MLSQSKSADKSAYINPTNKTARRSAVIIAPAVRLAAITGHVTDHAGTTRLKIAAALGYNEHTTSKYIGILCDSREMHRVSFKRHDGGIEFHYHAGPAPFESYVEEVETDDDPLTHQVVRKYPLHHARDLEVCAMFAVPAVLLEARP